MPAFRVVARLDVKTGHLVKGRQMEGVRKLGDPAVFAERYANDGADELLFCDVVASLYGRCSMLDVIEHAAEHVFIPITVVGGLRSVEDMRQAMRFGADKVGINTAAIAHPELITEAAHAFGKQAVVVSIEAKRTGHGFEAYTDSGREPTGKEVGEWAQEAQERGAGEILVTSVDRDGTEDGYDLDLLERFAGVSIPLVFGGGLRSGVDAELARRRADAASAGAAFHSGRTSIRAVKRHLMDAGIMVRPVEEMAA